MRNMQPNRTLLAASNVLMLLGAIGYVYLIVIRKPYLFSPELHNAQAMLLDLGFRETLTFKLLIASKWSIRVGVLCGIVRAALLHDARNRPIWLALLCCCVAVLFNELFAIPADKPAPWNAIIYFAPHVVMLLAAIVLVIKHRRGEPWIFQAGAIVMCLYPLSYYSVSFYRFESVTITTLGLFFLLRLVFGEKAQTKPRLKRICVAASVCLGVPVGLLQIAGATKTWYGYDAVFEVMQFAQMTDDDLPDLITWGFRGQAAGNLHVFPNLGKRFCDWQESEDSGFDKPEKRGEEYVPHWWYSGYAADLDNDGDADLLTDVGVLENTGSGLELKYKWLDLEQVEKLSDSKEKYWLVPSMGFGCRVPETRFWHGDLNHDGLEDFIMAGANSWSLWLSHGNFEFDLFVIPSEPPLPRVTRDGGCELVFFNAPVPDEVKKLGQYTITASSLSLPNVGSSNVWGALYDFIDLNGDGKQELVSRTGTAVESNGLFGDSADDRRLTTTVCIYADAVGNGEYQLVQTFTTKGYPDNMPGDSSSFSRPSIGLVFADFDRDGLLDFVGDDKRIYRQTSPFTFEQTIAFKMPRKSMEFWGDRMYAFDVDGDGWVDIVSNYRPWENVAYGPLIP